MKTIAIINRKGGVGKTTTACNLAYWVGNITGESVLLLDLDSQANASSLMLGYPAGDLPGVGEWILTGMENHGSIGQWCKRARFGERKPTVWVCPPGDLMEAEEAMTNLEVIGWGLTRRNQYMTIMDCPPAFDRVVLSALMAADLILLPTTTAQSSLDGAMKVLREISAARDILGEKELWLLPVMYRSKDRSDPAAWAGLQALKEEFGARKCGVIIPRSPKVDEAEMARRLLSIHSPTCGPSQAYRRLAWKLVKGGGYHD